MKQTSFLLIAALLCIGSISAQQQKTIFVPEAGTLKSQLTEEEAKNVTDLTLTGKINAIDFKAMRDEFNKLETLDISNANIRMYTGKKGTFSDKFYVYPMECVPAYAFKDKQTLKAIVLSPSLKNIEDCAFKGCKNLKRCYIKQKKTVNLLPDAMNDTLVAVFIPLGSKDVYRAKDKWKPYNLIEGEPISVEVIITEPGTLNQEILKTGKRPYEVNFLSVEGDLDRNDFKEIRDNMPQLVGIDFSKCTSGIIPEFTFSQKKYLMQVSLPKHLSIIGDRAFSGCIQLSGELILPKNVSEIGYGAFLGCDKLSKVIVTGDKPLKIGDNLFGQGDKLSFQK